MSTTGSSFFRRLHIVCTDKGTHGRAVLAVIDFERGKPLTSYTPTRMTEWWEVQGGHCGRFERIDFACPRCSRTPQVRDEKWRPIVDGYVAAGHADIDLSHLPF